MKRAAPLAGITLCIAAMLILAVVLCAPKQAEGQGQANAPDQPSQDARVSISVEDFQGTLPSLIAGQDFEPGKPVMYNPVFMVDEQGNAPLASLIEEKEAQGLALVWHTEDGQEFDWFKTPVTKSVSVVGTFVEAPYEVRINFNNEGATQDLVVQVPRGQTFAQVNGAAPEEPSKTGYEFTGWINANTGAVFDFDAPVTESTTVTAQFKLTEPSKVTPIDPSGDVPQQLDGRCYIGDTWSVHPAQFSVSNFTGGLEGFAGTGECSLPSAAAPSHVWADYHATLKRIDVAAGIVEYDVTITPPDAASPDGPRNQFGLIGYQTVYLKAVVKKNFGGYLEVQKASSNPSLSQGLTTYSLEGAVFGVFDAQGTRVAELTTNAEGKTDRSPLLPVGTYTIAEEKAPAGFAVAPSQEAQVVSGSVTEATFFDAPQNNTLSLLIEKQDAELDMAMSLGAATLEGAQFKVEYYDRASVGQPTPEEIAAWGAPKRAWVFQSNAQGQVKLEEGFLVEGDPFYTDSAGSPTLPLGTVVVTEIKAPDGYVLNGQPLAIHVCATGSEEHATLAQTARYPNQVIRGDFAFTKVAGGSMDRLANVAFRITSATTGESHVLVTDENGMASTAASWCPHSQNTNAGTSSKDGIWFGVVAKPNEEEANAANGDGASTDEAASARAGASNGSNARSAHAAENTSTAQKVATTQELASEAVARVGLDVVGSIAESEEDPYDAVAPVDDSLGALPYDTYHVEELASEANEGLELVSFDVTINRNNVTLDLGTIDNEAIPTEPEEPEEPDQPAEPEEPTEPEPDEPFALTLPKTGEEWSVFLVSIAVGIAFLAAMAGAGFAGNRLLSRASLKEACLKRFM